MFESVTAPSDSLRGLLQRGRGDGSLHALAADRRHASSALDACVTQDPRRDWQLESRSLYYARLYRELGTGLDGLRAHLLHADDLVDEAEERTGLTLTVLGWLTRYGRQDARALLHHYATHGSSLCWALDELALHEGDAALAALAPRVLARFPTGPDGETALRAAIRGSFEQHVWRVWAGRDSRVHRALEDVTVRRWDRQLRGRGPMPGWGVPDILRWADHHHPEPATLDRDGQPVPRDAAAARCLLPVAGERDRPLLLRAARDGAQGARCTALRHLATRQDSATLDLAELALAHADSEHLARTALLCLRQLGGTDLLRRARRWARDGDVAHDRRVAAGAQLLATAGQPADRDLVSVVLRDVVALHGPDDERVAPLVEGVGRLSAHVGTGADPAVVTLRWVYQETMSSHLRGVSAHALADADVAFADSFAVECLWDCEESTRELAARHAAIGDARVLRRLRNLAADPVEEDDVHRAAKGRLTLPH